MTRYLTICTYLRILSTVLLTSPEGFDIEPRHIQRNAQHETGGCVLDYNLRLCLGKLKTRLYVRQVSTPQLKGGGRDSVD